LTRYLEKFICRLRSCEAWIMRRRAGCSRPLDRV